MTAYTKVDGSWKEVAPQAKINGEWKTLDSGYVKVEGEWKQFFISLAHIFIAVAQDSAAAATSTDGITWTARTMPSSQSWRSVTYGNNLFVSVGGQVSAASTNGITWTQGTLPLPNNYYVDIAYGNNNFVAIASRDKICATSTDGISWTQRSLFGGLIVYDWESVAFGNNIFVVVENKEFSGTIATSSDGISWTQRSISFGSRLRGITYGNEIFVVVGSIPTAATSTDGITWTARTMPSNQNWRLVTYGNNTFVAVASFYSTAAATSTDGITWTARTMPSSQNWISATYGNGTFIAVANNTVATSTDGITWTARTMPSSQPWTSIASKLNPEIFSVTIPDNCFVGTPIIPSISYFAQPDPTFSYQWQRAAFVGAAWQNISGANESSYTPILDDLGAIIRVVVTASNIYGSNSINSNSSTERSSVF